MILVEKILNLFVSKNALLQEDLEAIKAKIESANNLDKLLDVCKFIESLNLNFKSERLAKNYMIFLGAIFVISWLILFVLMSQMTLFRGSFEIIKYCFVSFFGIILLSFLYGWWICKKVFHTQQISNLIFLKKIALDHNLVFDNNDKKSLQQFLEDKFFIFQQGNYSREIIWYIKGEYQNKFSCHYFHFHYVDQYTSTSTDANGNKTSDTRYEDYDLYGIIIPFNEKHFIKISNYENVSSFIKWKTSSISFNQKFNIYTDNEQAIAMFLQPKVIEKIENLYETFPKLDIEISPQGTLALSTPDEGLLNHARQYGVDRLALFKEEIKKVLDQTKFYKALEFISFLIENHQQI